MAGEIFAELPGEQTEVAERGCKLAHYLGGLNENIEAWEADGMGGSHGYAENVSQRLVVAVAVVVVVVVDVVVVVVVAVLPSDSAAEHSVGLNKDRSYRWAEVHPDQDKGMDSH